LKCCVSDCSDAAELESYTPDCAFKEDKGSPASVHCRDCSDAAEVKCYRPDRAFKEA